MSSEFNGASASPILRSQSARPSAALIAVATEDGKQEKNESATAAQENSAEEKTVISADKDLPVYDLSPELMYQILAAEIEFQRGKWEGPYLNYMGAAQTTRDPRLAHRAAEIAWSGRQLEPTMAAIRLWRELAPHSEEAAQHYLNFLILSDKLDEAKLVFAKTLQESPALSRGLVMFQIQQRLAQARDKRAGFDVLEEVLQPYGEMVESHLVLAYGALAAADSNRAVDEAQKALSQKPDSELAARTMAQVMPDKNKALEFLQNYLKAHPGSRNVRADYANVLVEQHLYERARQEYVTLLKLNPHDATTLYTLGQLARQTKDDKAAEEYLTAYLDALPANPNEERDTTRALLQLAQIADERKDRDAAIKWLSRIEGGEAYLSSQIWRAQLMSKRGEWQAANDLLQGLEVGDEKEQVQIIIARAQLLRDAGRLPEALAILEDGNQQFPDNVDLMYDYAMAAEKVDMFTVCEKTLRKIIEISPKNQQAYNALGYALAERNIRLEEAQQLIDTALKLAPDDPFILDSMGWVHYRQGKLKEAEDLLRRAYQLRADPEIAVHLGEVLWIKGERADANKLWREAGHKDPENDTLKSTLARLNVSL